MILEQLILILAIIVALACRTPVLACILFAALMICSGIDKILRLMKKLQKQI